MPQTSPEDLLARQKWWGTQPRPASPIREGQLTGGNKVQLTGGNKVQSKGQQGKGQKKQYGRARSQTDRSTAPSSSSGYGRPEASASGYGRAQSADKARLKRPREPEPDVIQLVFKEPDPSYPVIISVV